MDISQFIDERNKIIYEEIKSKININFSLTEKEEYACYSEGKNATIYISKNNISIEAFTHELLHLYLRIKEVYAGGCLKRMVNGSSELNSLFDNELLDHFSNSIDHIKMLPIYLELGFEKKKFISDYAKPKCTQNEINVLQIYSSSLQKLKPDFFKLFTGKYFAMKACPNDKHDYTKYYLNLSDLDSILLQNLEKFYNEWNSFNIYSNNILDKSYHEIVTDLILSFKVWDIAN